VTSLQLHWLASALKVAQYIIAQPHCSNLGLHPYPVDFVLHQRPTGITIIMTTSDDRKTAPEEFKQQFEKQIYESADKIGLVLKEVKVWITNHLRETASIVIIIVAAPLAIAVLSKVLAVAGFTTKIAAGEYKRKIDNIKRPNMVSGSLAARWQSLLPVPTVGSLFSTLQKAGASRAGLAAIETVVGRTATALAFAVTAPGLIKSVMEGVQERRLVAKL
jgi:hypothetical protein